MINKKSFLLAAALMVFTSGAASAATISFFIVPGGSSSLDLSAQLRAEVTDEGAGLVGFTFYNDVGKQSSITDIYFDDGTLLDIGAITSSGSGVSFTAPATPGDLPGGSSISPKFETTEQWSLDSTSPMVPQHGVDQLGEWVKVVFSLQSGQDYDDTLAALADGTLRLGLHVQAIEGGGSSSWVSNPLGVPDGGTTALLLGLGMLGLGYARRRLQ